MRGDAGHLLGVAPLFIENLPPAETDWPVDFTVDNSGEFMI